MEFKFEINEKNVCHRCGYEGECVAAHGQDYSYMVLCKKCLESAVYLLSVGEMPEE